MFLKRNMLLKRYGPDTYSEHQGNILQLRIRLNNADVGMHFWRVWSVILRETANGTRAVTSFFGF